MKKIISLQKNEDMTLSKAFENFICMRKALGLSEATIKSYECRFKHFTEFFPADNLCSDVSSTTIFEFIEFLKTRNPDIKPVSINTYLRHLRAIFYYFMEEEYMGRFKIKMISAEEEIIETYTNAEMERLLKKPDIKTASFSEYRNWVMICYLYGTGNRLDTVSNLKINDIDFENHEIALRRVKNKQQYKMPLNFTLEKILSEYLRYRKGEPEDYLFCNQFGGQLKPDAITTAIFRYNHSRGVTRTSVHLFRHTFATEYVRNGGRDGELQKLLGHKTAHMTKKYVHLGMSDVKKDFNKFNPLEKMKAFASDPKAIKIN